MNAHHDLCKASYVAPSSVLFRRRLKRRKWSCMVSNASGVTAPDKSYSAHGFISSFITPGRTPSRLTLSGAISAVHPLFSVVADAGAVRVVPLPAWFAAPVCCAMLFSSAQVVLCCSWASQELPPVKFSSVLFSAISQFFPIVLRSAPPLGDCCLKRGVM